MPKRNVFVAMYSRFSSHLNALYDLTFTPRDKVEDREQLRQTFIQQHAICVNKGQEFLNLLDRLPSDINLSEIDFGCEIPSEYLTDISSVKSFFLFNATFFIDFKDSVNSSTKRRISLATLIFALPEFSSGLHQILFNANPDPLQWFKENLYSLAMVIYQIPHPHVVQAITNQPYIQRALTQTQAHLSSDDVTTLEYLSSISFNKILSDSQKRYLIGLLQFTVEANLTQHFIKLDKMKNNWTELFVGLTALGVLAKRRHPEIDMISLYMSRGIGLPGDMPHVASAIIKVINSDGVERGIEFLNTVHSNIKSLKNSDKGNIQACFNTFFSCLISNLTTRVRSDLNIDEVLINSFRVMINGPFSLLKDYTQPLGETLPRLLNAFSQLPLDELLINLNKLEAAILGMDYEDKRVAFRKPVNAILLQRIASSSSTHEVISIQDFVLKSDCMKQPEGRSRHKIKVGTETQTVTKTASDLFLKCTKRRVMLEQQQKQDGATGTEMRVFVKK